MRPTSARVAVVAAALLVFAVPALAQEDSHAVSFDGIGFTFDRSLGSGVDVSRVPAGDPDASLPEGPDGGHTAFTFHGSRAEGKTPPRVGWADGVIRVYRVADLAAYELLRADADQLRTLLADRPDLSAFSTVHGDQGVEPLPLLGLYGAATVLQARPQYIDAPGVSGISYVGAYAQDIVPLESGSFWYLFQGLSPDGETYVSVTWVLDTDLFPPTFSQRDANRIASRYAAYVTESIATLEAAAPDAFTPSLDALDTLARSITLPGAAVGSPSPEASPAS